VAFERFQTWRPMEREEETSLNRGQWKNILAWWLMEKHYYLMVNGKIKNFFVPPPPTVQPKRFFFNLVPIDFKVFFLSWF